MPDLSYISKKSIHVITIWNILKRIATSSKGNEHLNLTKVEESLLQNLKFLNVLVALLVNYHIPYLLSAKT